jgi:hypothetical protein
MTDNLPVPDDVPWLNLSPEEVEQLRKQKHELTAYGKEKIRKMKAQQHAQKIVEATMEHTLRPQKGDRERVIAEAFLALVGECGYSNFNIDGDHGMLVVNVKDILDIIEVLEND